jgi:hypothetical protein
LVRFTAVFTNGVANSRQLIGVGDSVDGFFFGFNGTAFGILHRRNSIDTWIPQTDWNGDAAEFSPVLGNIFQIRYQWLGFGRIHFYVLDPQNDIGYVNVHTINYPNQNTGVSILNPTLPLYAQVLNTGNTSNLTLSSPSAVGFTEGQTESTANPLDLYRSRDATATFSDTNNNHLLTIRNKSTFNSLVNRLPVLLRSLSIGRGAAGAATSSFRLYRNATFAGALVYTDVHATNSPVEYSATSTTITSTDPIATFSLAEGNLIVPYNGEIVLQPGDTLTVGVQDSTAPGTVVAGTFNWVEQF